jgi:polar amino acid transport system substrate-binding protein
MKHFSGVLALLLVVALLFSGCSASAGALETVRSTGVLRVLVVEEGGRYSRPTADGSGREGIETDIVREVATDLGVNIEFHPVAKSELLTLLNAGEADVAIGRIAASDSLRYNYAVSLSYASGRLFAVTPRGAYFPSIGSLAGKTVGVSDQLSEPAGVAVSGIPDVVRQDYTTIDEVEKNLNSGAISAYICYEEQALTLIESPSLQADNLLGVDSEQYVFAAKKGNTTLITEVNKTVTRLLEAQEIAAFFERYPPHE